MVRCWVMQVSPQLPHQCPTEAFLSSLSLIHPLGSLPKQPPGDVSDLAGPLSASGGDGFLQVELCFCLVVVIAPYQAWW